MRICKIFLTYDFVHVIKNIKNNCLNLKNYQKTFIYPDFDDDNVIHKTSFEHLREFYKNEKCLLVKKANKLNYKTVFPNTFERQKVLLVDNIFHHSIIAALTSESEFKDTAYFLNIIKKWWDVVNSKRVIKGLLKRND
jgi:hypothetical protein